MARERRLFSEEFKLAPVKQVDQLGANKAGIALDLGVHANLLGHWSGEANVDKQVCGGEEVSSQDYERMWCKLTKVKVERDILKKALD